jgi:hypothetical protein
MRTINACLVIMITILGFTNSFDFASITEIQSLKQNSFASSLIETISLSLAADKQNGVIDVLKMLQDLQIQLGNDQRNDDNTFNVKNAQYTAHIKKLDAAIERLRIEIAALTARILVLDGLIVQARKNIKSFTARIVNLKRALIELDNKLVEDTKYYTNRAAALAQVNVKLLSVNARLGKMIGSVSGQNVASHINQTASEKRDIAYAKASLKKSFIQISKESPLETNLVEMFLQADQRALKKLMTIINKFAEDCLVQKARAERKLVEAKETHKTLTRTMNNEIALNIASRARQIANEKAYVNERIQKKQLRREKEERKAALEKERGINLKLQQNLLDTYQREKADRAEEIRVVGILVGIVQTRLMRTPK